jgi:hypothetical protein
MQASVGIVSIDRCPHLGQVSSLIVTICGLAYYGADRRDSRVTDGRPISGGRCTHSLAAAFSSNSASNCRAETPIGARRTRSACRRSGNLGKGGQVTAQEPGP